MGDPRGHLRGAQTGSGCSASRAKIGKAVQLLSLYTEEATLNVIAAQEGGLRDVECFRADFRH